MKLRFLDKNGNLYPDWEEKGFSDVLETNATKKFQIFSKDVKPSGLFEVVDQGKSAVAGYSDDKSKVFSNLPAIVYGDHTTIIKLRQKEFVVGADGTKVLTAKNSDSLDFLFYALHYYNVEPEGYKRHYSIVNKISLPIPSLSEQKKIAEFFSALDERINLTADKVRLLKEQKQGYLQRVFSGDMAFTDDNGNPYPAWETKQLGNTTEVSDGLHFTPTYTVSGVPFWSVETISSNVAPKFISEEAYQKDASRTAPKYGDILMTRIGTMGKTRLVDWHEKFSIYVSLALIKSNPIFNSKYLNQYFQTGEYKKSLTSKSLTTASPQKINMGDLKETIVRLPSLPEQEKIAEFFSALDEQIELNENKLTLLKEQKKGYLQGIFG